MNRIARHTTQSIKKTEFPGNQSKTKQTSMDSTHFFFPFPSFSFFPPANISK